MVKIRISIPSDLAVKVLFASDYTCCVCRRERGKTVIIHHIDETPNNNTFENLSVLCLECHNKTQIKGGFGRRLNAPLVIKYRDEWLERVKLRRNLADEAAVKIQVGKETLSELVEKVIETPIKHTELKEPLLKYINSLPKKNKGTVLCLTIPHWHYKLSVGELICQG